jgi:hypothetical protein
MVLGLLIFTIGDPGEGQSQVPKDVLTAIIFCLSVAIGALGGWDIWSAARVINGQNAGVAQRTAILLFLGALGTICWRLSSGLRPSVGIFALALLALYLCVGAFLNSIRAKSRHHSQ